MHAHCKFKRNKNYAILLGFLYAKLIELEGVTASKLMAAEAMVAVDYNLKPDYTEFLRS